MLAPRLTRKQTIISRFYIGFDIADENKPVISLELHQCQQKRTSHPSTGVRCRLIQPADLGAVAQLLAAGFPRHDLNYWNSVLRFHQEREVPDGFPRFGYVLMHADRPVGVLLLIYTAGVTGKAGSIRCNLSSWYVSPEYRNLAALLVLPAIRHKEVTFINVWPAENTLPIIEAQGFRKFSAGVFASVPALMTGSTRGRIRSATNVVRLHELMPGFEINLLRDHESRGCMCLVVQDCERCHPIVIRRRWLKYGVNFEWLPAAQLIYSRGLQDIVRYSGLIGRYLAFRGMPLLLIGANGAIDGLPGQYHDGRATMYYRGPDQPRLGDMAYTDAALFGA